MLRDHRSLFIKWIGGMVAGTLIIAVTSPLFVRSYLPLHASTARGVWVLQEHQVYRWRSEGYANTSVGPHGMPGRSTLDRKQAGETRAALWGDSQAEGVAVRDSQKLFAQTEEQARRSDFNLSVLPLTRSGEEAANWLTQFPLVEPDLNIDVHVFLVAELVDLQQAIKAPLPPPSEGDVARANRAFARWLPAFLIQGARNLLTESDGEVRRKLRFSVGKVDKPAVATPKQTVPESRKPATDWQPQVNAIAETATRPVIVVYAPKIPIIFNGKVLTEDPDGIDFLAMKEVAESKGIVVIDVRAAMLASAELGEWPHGFHNGQIGVGHLNATGYRIIAEHLVPVIQEVAGKAD